MPKSAYINNYNLIKTLGSGLNSKVKLAIDKTNGSKYAIKILTEKNDCNIGTSQKALVNEALILKELTHNNITKVWELSNNGNLITEDGKKTSST